MELIFIQPSLCSILTRISQDRTAREMSAPLACIVKIKDETTPYAIQNQ
jgi:hypothetical protein